MQFVAVDIETANADMSSTCQIGFARYDNQWLVGEWQSYINPQDFFDPINVSIHGINEATVADAPIFLDIGEDLYSWLDDQVCVSHTHFDRVAILQAVDRYGMRNPSCKWLDSARVAIRAWAEFAWKGYGLSNICEQLGYDFKHHDALEDAKAAGHILITAMAETGLSFEEWMDRVGKPIDLSTAGPIRRSGDPSSPLFGEVLVFTGALKIPRRQAADLASNIGCDVASGVTKETTILVVGDHDIQRLAGHEKSSKHRKAEDLIQKGHPIRILRESDFIRLIEQFEDDVVACQTLPDKISS